MKLTTLIAFGLLAAFTAQGGRIVVNNDEWTLSDSGFSTAGGTNAQKFAVNSANYLTGGSGSILMLSNNFGVIESSLVSALTAAGYTVTVDSALATPFTGAGLSPYQAIFLGGNLPSLDNNVLIQYVNNGGGVYLAGGTAAPPGGAAGEAAFWNTFLNAFGLQFASTYNGVGGNAPVSSGHPVLAGVSQLYFNNGNSVSTTGTNAGAQVILSTAASAQGLIAVVDAPGTGTPEPATLAIAGAGLVALGLLRRLRHS